MLGELGYAVSALHVNHHLRGSESDDDARFCREQFGAEIVDGARRRDRRRAPADPLRLRDGSPPRHRPHALGPGRDDPLPARDERHGEGHQGEARGRRRPPAPLRLADATRAATARSTACRSARTRRTATRVRGLIRDEVLPLLRRIHPAADENLLRALDRRETLPPALAELLADPAASKRVDLGGGIQAVREYDRLWLERSPVALDREVRWGPWRITSSLPGLKVRTWRPGDRLAGRSKKIQDLFVDAKIPRSEREQWPLVVRGDEIVAVPGIVDAPGVEATRE